MTSQTLGSRGEVGAEGKIFTYIPSATAECFTLYVLRHFSPSWF